MMAVAQDSGVDLTYLAYCDLCGLPKPAPKARAAGKRVGLLAQDIHASNFYRRLGRLSLRSWLWSWLRARDVHFAWDDMGPMRGYFWMMADQWKKGKYRTLPANFPPPEVLDGAFLQQTVDASEDKIVSLVDSDSVNAIDVDQPRVRRSGLRLVDVKTEHRIAI